MNMIETMPAEPFVPAVASFAPVVASKALNVPETISAKTAMISSENSQQKIVKSFLPSFPIYFSISMPIDLP